MFPLAVLSHTHTHSPRVPTHRKNNKLWNAATHARDEAAGSRSVASVDAPTKAIMVKSDDVLNPPCVCCGREFTLRRALVSHQSNHKRCTHCDAFEGCTAALKVHEWAEHGIGKAPPTMVSLPSASEGDSEAYTRRDGVAFKVIEETEQPIESIESRFPDADILWSLDGRTASAEIDFTSERADSTVGPTPVEWPDAECRVLLILGDMGSGKTRLLRALAAGAGAAQPATTQTMAWPRDRSILDGIGEDAASWLGAVGLNSVPLWCQPHAALSTGEAFRAELARRLKLAAAAHHPIVVDDFCDHLDPLSAACTAASLARHLCSEAGRTTRAILASSHAGIAPFLRPDAVLLCVGDGRPAAFLRNERCAAPLPLQIRVEPRASDAPVGSSSQAASGGGELFLQMLRRSGLRILHEQSYDDTPAFQHDVLAASRPRGGTVLAARVEATDATRSCETFFDLPHDGTCAKRIARFPSRDELLAPLADAKLRRPWLGLICGPSGSSKSAILAVHFGASASRHWERGTPLADAFKSAEQRDRCMRAAALPHSADAWRASDCSAGQLAQVRLALTLASAESAAGGSFGGATADEGGDGIALFDEFGSAWDETTAARIAAALTRSLGELRCRGVVLAGCHASCVGVGALAPDWIFEASSATCLWLDAAQQQGTLGGSARANASPLLAQLREAASSACVARADDDGTHPWHRAGTVSIEPARFLLTMRPCAPSAWCRFHAYHYKTPELSTVASTFILEATFGGDRNCIGEADHRMTSPAVDAGASTDAEPVCVPVGFVATIPHSGKMMPGATMPPQRAHRTVVLPEWQGFGVGGRLSDAAGEWHRRRGSDYYGQTVHPRFGSARDASPLWEATETNHTTPHLRWLPRRLTGAGHQKGSAVAVKRRNLRMVYAHRYVGPNGADEAQRYLEARVTFAQTPEDGPER